MPLKHRFSQLKLNARSNVGAILLFPFLFFLFLPFRHLKPFLDESDNFLGGMVVASGGDIYSGYPSQHTPLMYYISAIFRLLGASSLLQFRLYSYLFLSALYVGLYKRYSNYFGKLPLIAYLITYIALLVSGDFAGNGHKFLSEQIQSQAMVVLFLEFLLYLRQRSKSFEQELSFGSLIAISLGSFFAVGTAFVSLFAVSFYFLSFAGLEFIYSLDRESKKLLPALKSTASRLIPLGLAVALPFLLLIAWYYFTGNLHHVYEQAYYLNTTVYPKYNGGLGGDKFGAALHPFYDYLIATKTKAISVLTGISTVLFHPSENGLKQIIRDINFLLCVFCNLAFLGWLFRNYDVRNTKTNSPWIRTIAIASISIFLIQNGIRGFLGFHAMSYWAISLMMGALLLGQVFQLSPNFKLIDLKTRFTGVAGLFRLVFLCFVIACLFSPYGVIFVRNIRPTTSDWNRLSVSDEDPYPYYIEKLTTKSDRIYIQSLDHINIYVEANRLPATQFTAVVPWFAEIYEKQLVLELNKNKPKLIIYNPKGMVWGLLYETFAPQFDAFVRHDYILAPFRVPLWIRKDLLPEAKKIASE